MNTLHTQMPDQFFSGKNAVITGGRRGIGRAVALALARRGANIAIIAKSSDGSEIISELQEAGGKAVYISADLSRPEKRSNLIAESEKLLHGPVDILFNNAGSIIDGSILTLREEDYILNRELLLDASIDLMRQAVNGMCERRYGKIINVTSIFGIRNAPSSFCYSVFKRAIIAATECAAKCAAPYNVNINAIAPGTVRTDLTESRGDFNPDNYKTMLKSYPAHRLGETSDIVNAFLFLASDDSSFIHGHTLVVDGGYLL